MIDLRTLNKKRLLDVLDGELLNLLEVARVALDSWPMRMQVELRTRMTEAKLESLLVAVDNAAIAASEGGLPEKPKVYTNDFHDAEPSLADLDSERQIKF
jgi:hypothetical protein